MKLTIYYNKLPTGDKMKTSFLFRIWLLVQLIPVAFSVLVGTVAIAITLLTVFNK